MQQDKSVKEGALLLTDGGVQGGADSLEEYLEQGGLAALDMARESTPTEIITKLRRSALRARSRRCRQVFEMWWEMAAKQRGGVLEVWAPERDPRSLAEPYLLENQCYRLAEALAVCALVTGANRVRLSLAPRLAPLAIAVNESLADLTRSGRLEPGRLTIISAASGEHESESAPVLSHDLETWHLALQAIARGPEALLNAAQDGQSGTRLVTMGGLVVRPGLFEVPMGCTLADVLARAGGANPAGEIAMLSLDAGLSGFLAPEAADTPLLPEELMAAGAGPCPGTVWALDRNYCVVDLTRQALTRLINQKIETDHENRSLCLHANRLATQISLRRGRPEHLTQLKELARQMTARGAEAAWALSSSLTHFEAQWQDHLSGISCSAFNCLEPLTAPCQPICPAGIDIPSFVALVGHGRYREAVEVIRRDNPLPYICGLVCPAPCEKGCLRGLLDQPISIRTLKEVAARNALAEGGYPMPERSLPTGKKVAVIGAGPAGLTAAWFSALRGHAVTLFEAAEKAGGTMLMGIPAYRLPREVIEAEVAAIAEAGVDMRMGQALGRDFSLDDLRDQGFDTVFLAIGAHKGFKLRIPGENELPEVLDGISFLRQVSLEGAGAPADEVVVVGGGNAAMDAARTCVRLGCKKVTIAYRRTRAEMPAHEEEIEAALDEGVVFSFLTVPLKVEDQDGKVSGLTCLRAEMGRADASGRRRPVPVEGSDFTIKAGAVIAAIGQQPDLACFTGSEGPAADPRSRVLVDAATLQTNLPWLFAGGDAVTGPATVVEAVAAGKRAASVMDSYLRDMPPELGLDFVSPRARVEPLKTTPNMRTGGARPIIPTRPPAERVRDFEQVELGLTAETASREAMRCLRCDICLGCGLCLTACAEMGSEALRFRETDLGRQVFMDFEHPASACVGCGSCANSCPTGAIVAEDVDGKRRIVMTGTLLNEVDLVPCSICGKPYAPQAYLDRLAQRLKDSGRPDERVEQHICPECGRARMARARQAANMAAIMPRRVPFMGKH